MHNVRGQPHFHSKAILKFFQLWPQTPSAFFGLWPPPSCRNILEFFLLQASSSNLQHHYVLLLLIPKPKFMPRSISMPRSQPMSNYPLYLSLMFCHSQAPISAATKCLAQPEISINPPSSAETLIITHKPCIISKDGNKVATFYPLALCTLATRSQVYWKDCSPSTVSI